MAMRISEFLTSSDRRKRALWLHLYLLVFLSILMVYVSRMFFINDLFDHPQFNTSQLMTRFAEVVKASDSITWYYGFFVTDFFWALTLLTFCGHLLQFLHRNISETSNHERRDLLQWVFLVLASLAYLSDVLEGILYSSFYFGETTHLVVTIKKVLYTVTGIYFLFGLIKYLTPPRPDNPMKTIGKGLRIFFTTSHLSILLVLFIVFVGAAMPQGYTMVVDLMNRPLNLLFVYLLLLILSIVVSHYPAYFESRQGHIEQSKIHWQTWPEGWLFGLNYYYLEGKSVFNPLAKSLRYHLGTAIFVAFLYILGYAGDSIFQGFWFKREYAFLAFLLAIWLQYKLTKI